MNSPKEVFYTCHPSAAEDLQKFREAIWMKVAVNYTLAELANNGATQEQLKGARDFVNTFLHLWEKPEAPKKLPVKALETYDKS
jgi:hypothetical protein